MKERTMYILCLSAVVGFCTFKAFAASYHEPIQVESPTINVDADCLSRLRKVSADSGVPYQRLINRIIRSGLEAEMSSEERLSKLEKEIALIKKRLKAA